MTVSNHLSRNPAPPTPVILTTDCGTEVDDQWALAHLHLTPEIELRAVVTTHAPNLPPPAAEASAAECRRVLRHLPGGDQVPVIAGSSDPLLDKLSPCRNPGSERIVAEALREHSSPLTILVIGAATDVASALLMAPGIADRVQIVAMGFASYETGGDEWNVKNDPNAWRVLLESGAPITIGDASVCKQFLCLTAPDAHKLFNSRGSAGPFLAGLMSDWLSSNGETARLVTGEPDKWPVWDEITVAHLLGLTSWVELPRPSLRPDLTFDFPGSSATVRWIHSVDVDALWADLAQRCGET